jgi:hypothetical protein
MMCKQPSLCHVVAVCKSNIPSHYTEKIQFPMFFSKIFGEEFWTLYKVL